MYETFLAKRLKQIDWFLIALIGSFYNRSNQSKLMEFSIARDKASFHSFTRLFSWKIMRKPIIVFIASLVLLLISIIVFIGLYSSGIIGGEDSEDPSITKPPPALTAIKNDLGSANTKIYDALCDYSFAKKETDNALLTWSDSIPTVTDEALLNRLVKAFFHVKQQLICVLLKCGENQRCKAEAQIHLGSTDVVVLKLFERALEVYEYGSEDLTSMTAEEIVEKANSNEKAKEFLKIYFEYLKAIAEMSAKAHDYLGKDKQDIEETIVKAKAVLALL